MSCEGQKVLYYDARTTFERFVDHYELSGDDNLTFEDQQHHLVEAELLGIMFINRFPQHTSKVSLMRGVLAFIRRENIKTYE